MSEAKEKKVSAEENDINKTAPDEAPKNSISEEKKEAQETVSDTAAEIPHKNNIQ